MFAWHLGQTRGQLRDCGTAVAFHHADHHILAAAVAANALAQHAVGLADPRRVAKKQLEKPPLFCRRRLFQPLLGCLLHRAPILGTSAWDCPWAALNVLQCRAVSKHLTRIYRYATC